MWKMVSIFRMDNTGQYWTEFNNNLTHAKYDFKMEFQQIIPTQREKSHQKDSRKFLHYRTIHINRLRTTLAV